MSLGIFDNLSGTNEIFSLNDRLGTSYKLADYTSKKVILLSFIEFDTDNDIDWIARMIDLYNFFETAGTLTEAQLFAILYRLANPYTVGGGEIPTRLTGRGLSIANVKFPLLLDNATNGTSSVANTYKAGLSGVVTPFSYLVCPNSIAGSVFRVTDKYFLGSTDNGDGISSDGTNIYFDTLDHTKTFAERRMPDHYTKPVIAVFDYATGQQRRTKTKNVNVTLSVANASTAAPCSYFDLHLSWIVREANIRPAAFESSWGTRGVKPSIVLSDGDGVKRLFAWVKDDACNVSDDLSTGVEFVLDTVRPAISLFKLTSSNPTKNRAITFDLAGDSEIDGWIVWENAAEPDPTNTSIWSAVKPTGCQLSDSDGTKTLYAWAKDGTGWINDPASPLMISVILNRVKPVITRFALGVGGRTPTNTSSIPLDLASSKDPDVDWHLNENGTLPANADELPSLWGPKPANVSLSAGDGPKTLYAWARDKAHNMSDPATLTVTLDTKSPRIVSIEPFPDPVDGTVDGRNRSDLKTIDVTFGEEVRETSPGSFACILDFAPTGTDLGTVGVASAVLSSPAATITLSGVPADGVLTLTLIGVQDLAGNLLENPAFSYRMQKPMDAVLVLDCSGSMRTSVAVNGGVRPKIDYLKDSVEAVAAIWHEHATNGDRLDLVYFHSTAAPRGNLDPVNQSFLTIYDRSNRDAIIADIRSQNASGCTAMGAGLAIALEMIHWNDSNWRRKRSIILFTDGMQNRNPLVRLRGSGSFSIENYASQDLTGSGGLPSRFCGDSGSQSDFVGVLPKTIDAASPIPDLRISTIGVGDGGEWGNLLREIAIAGGGVSHEESEIWPNLPEAMLVELIDSIRGNSLQIVRTAEGTVPEHAPFIGERFRLNGSVKKLTILVCWPGTEPLSFHLALNGREVGIRGFSVVTGATYRIASVNFPLFSQDEAIFGKTAKLSHGILEGKSKPFGFAEAHSLFQPISAEGVWEVFIEPAYGQQSSSIPYFLTVLAEDKTFEYDIDWPRHPVYIGDPAPFGVTLRSRSASIDTMYAVTARVRGPAHAFGDVLSEHAAEAKKKLDEILHNGHHHGDTASNRLDLLPLALRRIRGAATKLAARTLEEVVLIRSGGTTDAPRFSGNLTAGLPGIYSVDFLITGALRGLGQFERTERKTFIVRARPIPKETMISAIYEKSRVRVRLVPLYGPEHFLGPGLSETIKFELNGKSMGIVSDGFDSSYTIELPPINKEKFMASSISITMEGRVLFMGKGGDIVSARQEVSPRRGKKPKV